MPKKINNNIISEKEYKEAEATVVSKVSSALIKGEKITLRNFGTFTVKKHKARKGVNPKTGTSLNIPSKLVVKFNSCKKLKNRVNKQK